VLARRREWLLVFSQGGEVRRPWTSPCALCDSKRSPGRLSRQGPEVLRWLLFEAAKTSAREWAPAHPYYTSVRQRYDGNRAALSQARRIVRQAVHILADLGDDAFTIIRQSSPSAVVTE
jgi:hypothetical protein